MKFVPTREIVDKCIAPRRLMSSSVHHISLCEGWLPSRSLHHHELYTDIAMLGQHRAHYVLYSTQSQGSCTTRWLSGLRTCQPTMTQSEHHQEQQSWCELHMLQLVRLKKKKEECVGLCSVCDDVNCWSPSSTRRCLVHEISSCCADRPTSSGTTRLQAVQHEVS